MSALRRYEIYLPRRFNDGALVPEELHGELVHELRERFGAVTHEMQVIEGQWEHGGTVYRDQLVKVFVDVAPSESNRQIFVELKQRLKARFRQIDIWITAFDVETI